ncbi:MAG: cation:proton antiporter subunit C [Candidatus Aenigmatarchaeota archaeon]|nr:MAG: cation:proton antiporter subunit C [Candidatus Aenigmarchaeota archaeon]
MIPYLVAMVLVMIGIYTLLVKENLVKKIMGLTILTNGIHLLLISIGYRMGGIAPILQDVNFNQFITTAVDPLPQALVLTSIVINLSVTAVALSLVIMVYRRFNTLEAKNIRGLKG